MTAPLLTVRLSAGYGKSSVLENVRLEIGRGELVGLVGSSGAGKSTLVTALLGLLPWRRGWATGEVCLNGVNLLHLKEREARTLRGKQIALVPQSPMSALNSAVTLRRHFEAAWRAHESRNAERLDLRLHELLQQVRLPLDPAFLNRRPGEISVGQAQRIVMALALLHRPALLIADEPTSALDPATQADLLTLLRETNRTDRTAILYISHDILSVLQFCQRVALLHEGHIAECRAIDSLAQPDCHPEMQALLGLLPVPLPWIIASRTARENSALTDAAEDVDAALDRSPATLV